MSRMSDLTTVTFRDENAYSTYYTVYVVMQHWYDERLRGLDRKSVV